MDRTADEPQDWTLPPHADPEGRETFDSWRAQFVTTVRLAPLAAVEFVQQALASRGIDAPLTGGWMDQAAATAAAALAGDLVFARPEQRQAAARLSQVAQVAMVAQRGVTFQVTHVA